MILMRRISARNFQFSGKRLPIRCLYHCLFYHYCSLRYRSLLLLQYSPFIPSGPLLFPLSSPTSFFFFSEPQQTRIARLERGRGAFLYHLMQDDKTTTNSSCCRLLLFQVSAMDIPITYCGCEVCHAPWVTACQPLNHHPLKAVYPYGQGASQIFSVTAFSNYVSKGNCSDVRSCCQSHNLVIQRVRQISDQHNSLTSLSSPSPPYLHLRITRCQATILLPGSSLHANVFPKARQTYV